MIDVTNPFDIVKCINLKNYIYFSDYDKKPSMYIVNRAFSNMQDTIFYANEVNKFSIDDEQMVFDFYYYALPLKQRYGKFYKKKKNVDNDFICAIMEIYNYSESKALGVYNILLPKRNEIMAMVFKGGKKKNNNK